MIESNLNLVRLGVLEINPPKPINLIYMKKITLISAFALAALVCTPFGVQAQDKPAAKTTEKSSKTQKYTPYAGTVDSVDKTAKTVTIKTKKGDSQVLAVTDTTKIENTVTKKDATLDDVAAGAYITGSYAKNGETLEAHSIHLGKDAPAEKSSKKSKAKATPAAADKPADAPAEKPAAPAEAK